ncbi:MAG TPA: pilus assembly protein PilP [Candidatus Binatia bacterium]|jgi:Tfp pilus assembly protein PilP|nr:pilus assembly protein PilP [Candidatus Binatia bacterium]
MANWKNIVWIILLSGVTSIGAQEELQTPSQKTKEAVDKLLQAPRSISKSLHDITEAAKAKLRGNVAETKSTDANSETPQPVELKAHELSAPNSSTAGRRDPFRPFTLNTRTHTPLRETLSPLERYELGQLKLVGIVWRVKEPSAMFEDSAGLGYIVKVGTPIGPNDGKVKAIQPDQIIVEETYVDLFGGRKRREVNIKLSVERKE